MHALDAECRSGDLKFLRTARPATLAFSALPCLESAIYCFAPPASHYQGLWKGRSAGVGGSRLCGHGKLPEEALRRCPESSLGPRPEYGPAQYRSKMLSRAPGRWFRNVDKQTSSVICRFRAASTPLGLATVSREFSRKSRSHEASREMITKRSSAVFLVNGTA
ncbi:hypothetical protein OPT61_g8945 [Boeremia exigua]|uniref:Uncharacterized protein n=1 Tax=Boeremia exigua TaxID=749465 RepID=A0ACC2HWS2_9PLEO|nr:hypothetical protein OPT61_g8945 [Boeremia exigua]